MRSLNYFFSHSFFISICAIGLVWQTNILLGIPNNFYKYCLVFSSALAAYNFYALVSRWFNHNDSGLFKFLLEQADVLLLTAISAMGLIYTLIKLPESIAIVAICAALTYVYIIAVMPVKRIVGLKKMGFLKTILLALVWSFATVMIPVVTVSLNLSAKILLVFFIRFSGLLMICLIFDLRDVHIDKINLLRTIIDINPQWIHRIMWVLLFFYSVFSILFVMVYSQQLQMFALLLAGAAALILYLLSLKQRGYYFYYFWVDGWMLFTAFLSYLATI